MESVKVYRSVNTGDRFFGLELADGVVLLLVFFLAFSFNREGLFSNGLVLVLSYFGIRAPPLLLGRRAYFLVSKRATWSR